MRDIVMRIVALALLCYALFGFAASLRLLEDCNTQKIAIEAQYDALRRENELLTAKIEAAVTPEGLQSLARERLALVMPGEKVFYFS